MIHCHPLNAYDEFMEGQGRARLPFKTPGFRVLPVEETLTGEKRTQAIGLDAVIPDQRQVLPLDVISELIKREEAWIAVAECYCRKTKSLVGQGCAHPLDTCMTFNELAQGLVKTGYGRKIDYEEAMRIVRQCEEAGLVHHVDNCLENARTLCNCCPCCCAAIKISEQRREQGEASIIAPSRYVVEYNAAKCTLREDCISRCPAHARSILNGRVVIDTAICTGCGLCVTACTQGANRMVLRDRPSKIPRTREKLYSKIGRELIWGVAKNKILRRSSG